VNSTTTTTPATTASWSIQHGQVRPDQIEVLWSDEDSETRTTRTARLSDLAGTVTLAGTNDTYEDALARAINELKSLPISADMVTVASVNVTSGSTAFAAQGMTHVEDAIQFIHEVLQRR
jgi:hypothetical protein